MKSTGETVYLLELFNYSMIDPKDSTSSSDDKDGERSGQDKKMETEGETIEQDKEMETEEQDMDTEDIFLSLHDLGDTREFGLNMINPQVLDQPVLKDDVYMSDSEPIYQDKSDDNQKLPLIIEDQCGHDDETMSLNDFVELQKRCVPLDVFYNSYCS